MRIGREDRDFLKDEKYALGFFYHAFTKLSGHLLNLAALQIQLSGELFNGQV